MGFFLSQKSGARIIPGDRRDTRGDELEGQARWRNRNESEETETFHLYPYLLQG